MSDHETDHETGTCGKDEGATATDGGAVFEAAEYESGAVTYPPHPVGPEGTERVGTIDLGAREATVITWTTSTATPPGVRQPNTLAIVAFDMGDDYDGPPVRALGQIADDEEGETYEVEIGDRVEPVYADELREPGAGIREPDSQDWDGFRFQPVE